jgi:hypothetical protein
MRVLEKCRLRSVNAEIDVSNRGRAVAKSYRRLLKCYQFRTQIQHLKYLEYFEYSLAKHRYIISTPRLMSLLLRSGPGGGEWRSFKSSQLRHRSDVAGTRLHSSRQFLSVCSLTLHCTCLIRSILPYLLFCGRCYTPRRTFSYSNWR